ncbi:MAG TPA: FAD-dependent oxidoreductase [Spongiibacteraceae bacterium]|nr:FAD-dependent oxidoreductase [Spongiibacteraceae bacterium]
MIDSARPPAMAHAAAGNSFDVATESFDVTIIGGGIQGAGIAQAASAAGYRTLLIERDEWASATSHASSKLIHGGLRYLESGQLNLVYHSLQERQHLLRNAPRLVKAVQFYIPIYRYTQRRPWQIRAGLSLYALLTGLHPQARFRSVPRAEWPALGGLKQQDLQAVFQYWDGQTDDAALTHAVVDSAAQLGAHCVQHCELIAAQHAADDRYHLQLRNDNTLWHCETRALVNATGPWVNELLKRCTPTPPQRALSWVKGTHIALPALPLPGIFYLEAPRDGRAVFVMPWQGKTLIGTTEVEVDSPLVEPSQTEIDYLLDTVRHYFPAFPLTVLDSFAGVRVLPSGNACGEKERPFSRARESVITEFDTGNAALISIYGGKLTTYRHTAEQVVDLLQKKLGRKKKIADTKNLPL